MGAAVNGPDNLGRDKILGTALIPAPQRRPALLQPLAEELEDQVADDGGYQGYGEVFQGENVSDCPQQPFVLSGGGYGVLAHQEIGVKEEDDEGHLHHGSPEGGHSPELLCELSLRVHFAGLGRG